MLLCQLCVPLRRQRSGILIAGARVAAFGSCEFSPCTGGLPKIRQGHQHFLLGRLLTDSPECGPAVDGFVTGTSLVRSQSFLFPCISIFFFLRPITSSSSPCVVTSPGGSLRTELSCDKKATAHAQMQCAVHTHTPVSFLQPKHKNNLSLSSPSSLRLGFVCEIPSQLDLTSPWLCRHPPVPFPPPPPFSWLLWKISPVLASFSVSWNVFPSFFHENNGTQSYMYKVHLSNASPPQKLLYTALLIGGKRRIP